MRWNSLLLLSFLQWIICSFCEGHPSSMWINLDHWIAIVHSSACNLKMHNKRTVQQCSISNSLTGIASTQRNDYMLFAFKQAIDKIGVYKKYRTQTPEQTLYLKVLVKSEHRWPLNWVLKVKWDFIKQRGNHMYKINVKENGLFFEIFILFHTVTLQRQLLFAVSWKERLVFLHILLICWFVQIYQVPILYLVIF